MKGTDYREKLLALFESRGEVSAADVKALMPGEPEQTVFSRIRALERKGIIYKSGKGVYSLGAKPVYKVPISPKMMELNTLLVLEFVGSSLCISCPDGNNIILYSNEGRPIKARTPNQKRMVAECARNDLVFAIGPAGSGKTYTAIALAVRALKNREVRRIILTRPAVEAGERLGFLPGDLKEKLDPYLQPLYDALGDMIPAKRLQNFMEEGIIQIAPLAYMRGRTLDRAFVILDEAQNTSLGQLKMFLTRMGSDAKFIVTGDATQIDLPNKADSGLMRGVDLVKDIKGISIVEFGKEDIVRHPLVTKIVDAFERI